MKEAKVLSWEQKYPKEFAKIRSMRAVRWAKVRGDYLYVCTQSNKLRYYQKVEGYRKYLPQIMIRLGLKSGTRNFKYRHFFTKELRPHPSGAMRSRIGDLEYRSGCLGEYDTEFVKQWVNREYASGVETLIQALQTIH